MHTAVSSLTFVPLTETIGAEIRGLDPQRISPDDRRALREAWTRYHVLVVRETELSEDEQIDFAASFGRIRAAAPSGSRSPLAARSEIMVISNIRDNGVQLGSLPDGEMDWHFDGLHQQTPYLGAVLHAIEVPTRGGETRFRNMAAVYAALPAATRARLAGLTALHVYDYTATSRDGKAHGDDAARGVHPVVRAHDVSGEPALYVCRLMTERIVELPERESRELLEELFAAIDAFPDSYEHAWRRGDTVIWDNRCVTHARNDFSADERRLLKRVTIVSV